jgi:adenosylcobyric acid synthase
MVQGTSSAAGKSTLVTALCRIFADRGLRVAPFKAQNMSSNLFTTSSGRKIALAQAIQAEAAKKEPDSRMNPILLKPLGEYRSSVILDGKFYSEMHAKEYYEKFALQTGLKTALRALESLRRENDLVVIEGAGSPAEVNIARYDIANMLLAHKAGEIPVIIVADIERGGCFASIAGTMQLLGPADRKLVKGFLINKFRGDASLLEPAIKHIEKLTRKRVLGVIPWATINLPDEDSLGSSRSRESEGNTPREFWAWQIQLVAKLVQDNARIDKITEAAGL